MNCRVMAPPMTVLVDGIISLGQKGAAPSPAKPACAPAYSSLVAFTERNGASLE